MEWAKEPGSGSGSVSSKRSGGKRCGDRQQELEVKWSKQTGERRLVYSAYGVREPSTHGGLQASSWSACCGQRGSNSATKRWAAAGVAVWRDALPAAGLHTGTVTDTQPALPSIQSPYECFFVKAPKVTPLDEAGASFKASRGSAVSAARQDAGPLVCIGLVPPEPSMNDVEQPL